MFFQHLFIHLWSSRRFVSTGSENNAVYVYYKALSKPVVMHKFQPGAQEGGEDTNFVSSVCWKKDSGVLLAANSLGVINVSCTLARLAIDTATYPPRACLIVAPPQMMKMV